MKDTILFIDDDKSSHNLVDIIVKTHMDSKYKILHAYNGSDGINLARSHQNIIGLIFIDIMLSDMQGTDAAKSVRAIYESTKIAIVFQSGAVNNLSQLSQNTCDNLHAMYKPYGAEEFVEFVHRLFINT